MLPRQCDSCFKEFAHRQLHFKHKKNCKGAVHNSLQNNQEIEAKEHVGSGRYEDTSI